MVDTHCHILPGIDDGAKTLDDAVELARIAAEDGIQVIATTPHVMEYRYPNTRATIEPAFAELSGAVAERGISLKLVPAAEVHVAADLVRKLKDGHLLTYDDNKKYMLLEFPFQQVVSGTEDVVYRLRLAGITPILAHPERIGFFMEDLERLHKLIKLGAMAQVTGGSLLGRFGEKAEQAAWKMVERRLVHVVASDAHDAKHRPPRLRKAVEMLAQRAGAEEAEQMSSLRPAAILEGREIEPPEPVPAPSGFKSVLGRFFSRS